MKNKILYILLAATVLASCATRKESGDATETQSASSPKAAFVSKVINGSVDVENIVGSASVSLKLGEKNITVPGSLRMRRDKVIRIQLFIPLLGTEVGRMEFTPDYVLVLDRINRRYVKGDYNQLDFLRNNGITFYSLQALFWNQLTLPGKNSVSANDMPAFDCDLNGTAPFVPITYSRGQMRYQWNASRRDNSLTSAVITYNSASHGTSMLSWLYSDFVDVAKKRFPSNQSFSFQTYLEGKKQQGEIKIRMNEIKTTGDWDTETTISSKYKKVEAEDILFQLIDF